MCICLVVQCRDRNSLVCVYLCLNHPSLTFPCCLFVILLRTYLLRTDINSVSALILFLCYDTKFHSSALSYINKPHANPPCAHWHHDRWLRTHNLIQDNLLFWDYWFVCYTMKQVSFRSIPTAVDFSMLAHSSHSNNVINIFSKMLNTQKYGIII